MQVDLQLEYPGLSDSIEPIEYLLLKRNSSLQRNKPPTGSESLRWVVTARRPEAQHSRNHVRNRTTTTVTTAPEPVPGVVVRGLLAVVPCAPPSRALLETLIVRRDSDANNRSRHSNVRLIIIVVVSDDNDEDDNDKNDDSLSCTPKGPLGRSRYPT